MRLQPYKFYILAAALAVAAAGGAKAASLYYNATISAMEKDLAAATLEATKANRKQEQTQLALTGALAARDAARNQKIRFVEREVVKEVIEYVKSPQPKCDVPADWVRIHNAAASGRVSEDTDATGAPDAPPRTFTDADTLTVVAENYATCSLISNRLLGLQEWADQITEVGG